MIRGFLIMLGLFALAVGIAVNGLSNRYQFFPAEKGDFARRVDGLTGEICLYDPAFIVDKTDMIRCAR